MEFPITYIGFPICMVCIWLNMNTSLFSQDRFLTRWFFHSPIFPSKRRTSCISTMFHFQYSLVVLFQCWMYEHEQLDSCLSLKGLNTLNYRTVQRLEFILIWVWQGCFPATQCQSVSTFDSEVRNSLSVLEPCSTDSLGHQHCAKKLSPKIALHFKVLCKSKATLPIS